MKRIDLSSFDRPIFSVLRNLRYAIRTSLQLHYRFTTPIVIFQDSHFAHNSNKVAAIVALHFSILLLTKDEHQDRHSGQTAQTNGERHRLANNCQCAKDKVADAIRFEMGVL